MITIHFINNLIGVYRTDHVQSWTLARELATREFDRPLEGQGICTRVVGIDAQLIVVWEPDADGVAKTVYEKAV